eukprot:5421523-Prorocentrum_lima.AAC.1
MCIRDSFWCIRWGGVLEHMQATANAHLAPQRRTLFLHWHCRGGARQGLAAWTGARAGGRRSHLASRAADG